MHRKPSEARYSDCYEAPLGRQQASIHHIYLEVFSHYPWWAQWALVIRGALGKLVGIHGPTLADFTEQKARESYAVGEKIGRFTLFHQEQNEIVTGGDDKHVNFRVSAIKTMEAGTHKLVLSTVVYPRNTFGKFYLLFILPFHRLGIRMLLSNAVKAGRI